MPWKSVQRIENRTDLRAHPGSFTIVSGMGGRGRERPVVRGILAREWYSWEDFQMVEAGRDRNGDRRYRKEYTPLGRAIRKFRKEFPVGAQVTLRDTLRTIPEMSVKWAAPLVQYLANHDLRFGMTDAEMDALVHAEEEADRAQERADAERASRTAILEAVLDVMQRPWLPSEVRAGRRLLEEDTYEGLQEELVRRGFTVTAIPHSTTVLVRPAR